MKTEPRIGDTVEYDNPCKPGQRVTAEVLDVFENGDIRTDRDGVRTSSEYEVIKKGVTDLHPVPLSKK